MHDHSVTPKLYPSRMNIVSIINYFNYILWYLVADRSCARLTLWLRAHPNMTRCSSIVSPLLRYCDRASILMIYQTLVTEIKLLASITRNPTSRMKVASTRPVSLRHVNLLRVVILTYTGKRIIDNVGSVSWIVFLIRGTEWLKLLKKRLVDPLPRGAKLFVRVLISWKKKVLPMTSLRGQALWDCCHSHTVLGM